MNEIRINKFIDPARGGRQIEMRTFSRRTTVLYPGGISQETAVDYWKDIGTMMEPITNHTPEQPASLARKIMQANCHLVTITAFCLSVIQNPMGCSRETRSVTTWDDCLKSLVFQRAPLRFVAPRQLGWHSRMYQCMLS